MTSSITVFEAAIWVRYKYIYRVAQKVNRYQMITNRSIVLKPANEIRFIRQIKVSINHSNNSSVSIKYSVRDLFFEVSNSA